MKKLKDLKTLKVSKLTDSDNIEIWILLYLYGLSKDNKERIKYIKRADNLVCRLRKEGKL